MVGIASCYVDLDTLSKNSADNKQLLGPGKHMTLYHGARNKQWRPNNNSCYTTSLDTAKDYAYFWSYGMADDGVKDGVPYIFVVSANFVFEGGADEHRMIGKDYKIEKTIKLPKRGMA